MKIKRFILNLFISLLVGFMSIVIYHHFVVKKLIAKQQIEQKSLNYGKTVSNFAPIENVDFTEAAEKAVHSVVHIKTVYVDENQNPMYEFFFGRSSSQAYMASGSGVIISSDGYIVTNNHVIDKSNQIEVVLNDKRSYKAKIIGVDPNTDLALLKIDAHNLINIPFGNSDELKIGEWVLAIGNPFNLTSTVTAGIVSAKARNINVNNRSSYSIESFIQTDAAVNPGNSGGALVNTKGELVGINTAIFSKTGSYTGYSFAIPASIVQKVVSDLMEYGVVQRALMGVSLLDLDANVAKQLGIDKIEGVFVSALQKNGAALKAGIQEGDIILKINNVAINKISEFQEQLSRYRPGDKIFVTVKRKGNIEKYNVILQNQRGTTKPIETDIESVLGARFEPLNNAEKEYFGIDFGVKITELYPGKLMKAGVHEGYIILYINKVKINSVDDIESVLKNAKGGVFVKGVYPNGLIEYYAFGID